MNSKFIPIVITALLVCAGANAADPKAPAGQPAEGPATAGESAPKSRQSATEVERAGTIEARERQRAQERTRQESMNDQERGAARATQDQRRAEHQARWESMPETEREALRAEQQKRVRAHQEESSSRRSSMSTEERTMTRDRSREQRGQGGRRDGKPRGR